jgi:hypothetical protein
MKNHGRRAAQGWRRGGEDEGGTPMENHERRAT